METNAILAINSLDRYTTNKPGQQNQPLGNALQQQYYLSQIFGGVDDLGFTGGPPCNNFSITSPGALLYGYISKLVVAEIQLNYNIPTVLAGLNDSFWIIQGDVARTIATKARITIPYGWYSPYELAAVLQVLIRSSDFGLACPDFTVTYNSTGIYQVPDVGNQGGYSIANFVFASNNISFNFFFPSLNLLNFYYETDLLPSDPNWITCLKAYRLLGLSSINSGQPSVLPDPQQGLPIQISSTSVNFLYTPYIDIISETLTKYQKVKDTDTSAQKQNSIITRLYLSGQGAPQYLISGTSPDAAGIIGARPFTVTQSTPNPKVIRWSKDEAINSIDFQLRDQYGDLIYSVGNPSPQPGSPYQTQYYFTEFQMTLLCTEGEI